MGIVALKLVEGGQAVDVESPDAADRALLAAVAAGDTAAFERLYRRHYRSLFDFAVRLTGRYDAAEEVASDALGVAWRKADSFQGRSRVSTWLFGIAYRMSLRVRSRDARRSGDVEFDDSAPAAACDKREVEAAFLRAQVARALDKLSADHRAVMELTYYHGLTCAEIAEVVECPVGTVKTRMMHARARLRGLLGGDEKGARDG